MLAGGIGGTTGDLLMHSLDTVKTRQQGDRHIPPKYNSMSSSYLTIFRQEGLRRGLYSGVTPAFLGSFPGTVIFFGTYEYSKRHMIDAGVTPSLAYLAGGWCIRFVAIPSFMLTCPRVPCRLRCLVRVCSFRGLENTASTAGSPQQSFHQFGLQLPLNCRCCSYHRSPRGLLRAVLWLQGNHLSRFALLRIAIRFLRARTRSGKKMGRE